MAPATVSSRLLLTCCLPVLPSFQVMFAQVMALHHNQPKCKKLLTQASTTGCRLGRGSGKSKGT